MTKETSNAIEVLGQLIWTAFADKPVEERKPIYDQLNRVITALENSERALDSWIKAAADSAEECNRQKKRAETAECERAKWEDGCRTNEECYKAAVRKQDEQRLQILELKTALQALYDETADYIRINHLGDVHHNRSMQLARKALKLTL